MMHSKYIVTPLRMEDEEEKEEFEDLAKKIKNNL